MSAEDYSLLLCTNGAAAGEPALEYGAWLAGQLSLPVTLLGIVEDAAEEAMVREKLEAAQTQLEAASIPYRTQVRFGRARAVVTAEAVSDEHLVVLGPMGRSPLRRWLRGRAFRRVMPDLAVPFIYTPTAHLRLERILMCSGALGHSACAECWALELARRMGAALTILHVVETAHFEYPTTELVEAHWRELLATDTPQARRLRSLLERAEIRGVDATFEVRRGLVIHEITARVREEPPDLVVMGSKYSSHSLRSHYLPDVTAGVMESVRLPVLVVRAGQRCILEERAPGGDGR